MKKFLIRLAINAVGLYLAVYLLNGHGLEMSNTNPMSFLWLALIFGVVNALIKPLLVVLTCPFIILTLGLGTLLINALLFYLAGLVGGWFGTGFTVDFWGAFLGSLIVSIVSFLLSMFLKEELREKRR